MYVCAFFIIWYPRACARYGIFGSVLVPARRAVCDLGIWMLGDFESWSGCLECGDFGMPRALRAVVLGVLGILGLSGDFGFMVRFV